MEECLSRREVRRRVPERCWDTIMNFWSGSTSAASSSWVGSFGDASASEVKDVFSPTASESERLERPASSSLRMYVFIEEVDSRYAHAEMAITPMTARREKFEDLPARRP